MNRVYENSIKPNFFIVGAAKAGTTSIEKLLRNHPDIYISPIKEPNYFCDDIRKMIEAESSRQQKGLTFESVLLKAKKKSVHMFNVTNQNDYEKLFLEAKNKKAVGECSTFYLPSKVAAKNIFNYNPNAKIIIITRNPFDRIISHYDMDIRIGITREKLKVLLEHEVSLGEQANYENSRFYLGASNYENQINEYQRYFSEKNVLILTFEDLINSQKNTIKNLLNFLELETSKIDLKLSKENEAKTAKYELLNYILYKTSIKSFILNNLAGIMPQGLKNKLKEFFFTDIKKSNVSTEDIEYLNEILRNN